MKQKLLMGLIASTIILSCSKNSQSSTPQTSFKFTVNGYTNEWDSSLTVTAHYGAEIKKELSSGYTGYSLYAQDGHSSINLLLATNTPLVPTLYTRTVTINTHSFPDEGAQYLGPATYFAYSGQNIGDNVNVTITRIQNGYADGYFTALMSHTNTASTPAVISGSFSNVKILE